MKKTYSHQEVADLCGVKYSRVAGWANKRHPAYIGCGLWSKTRTDSWINGEYRFPQKEEKKHLEVLEDNKQNNRNVENFFT